MPDNNIYDFDKIKKEKELQEQQNAKPEPDEKIKKIVAIYETFSESQQIIFSLYVILQCSTDTIAEMVDCDDAYAKHQLQMALTALMDTNFTIWEDA